jgi:hypothetical protein
MLDKHVQSGDWRVHLPDGAWLNMNSEEAVDYLLDLLRRVEELEAQLKKRQKRRAKARKEEGNEQMDL